MKNRTISSPQRYKEQLSAFLARNKELLETVKNFLFGLIASRIHMGLFPVYLFFFAVLMFLMSEKLNKVVGRAV